MTTREQLTEQRLAALIEVLVAQGTLPRDWADSVAGVHEIGQGTEIARAAREGRGPPKWAGQSGEQGNSNGANE